MDSDLEKARRILRIKLDQTKKLFPPNSSVVAYAACKLGNVLVSMGQEDLAAEYIQEGRRIYRIHPGPSHAYYRCAREWLEKFHFVRTIKNWKF